ncbi:iron complex transport system substrate-binding protein [Paenibacillus cellulosilyticus]|uniref:High-affinity heme uptake system protein IsdE n=1 Tax=Paenibacillus cellulosilyticus TaxID=375489 RepID=A0A2V2YV06_9BACL|nr:heme ABC transporter substrate-binding protein IsdE [Paenibacillus cellulosilyticus]PWW03290.1 iron complex transport system substrate-binding protein [Paenibacillus cellulosilyticus]QKS43767.1 heme ABC transporter substrate-binding protein IsdE [Paenibacillus cellulosilyticus]
MIARSIRLLVILGSLLALVACSSSNKTDKEPAASNSTNQSVTTTSAESSEHRIVSTTVAVTQIMDALELDLVGVPTSAKQLPERYKGVKEVGNPMSPDMEMVKSLKPTDVLSVTTLKVDLEPTFQAAKVNGTFLDLTSIASMQEAIKSLGEQFDRVSQADKVVQEMDDEISRISEEAQGKEKPTVLILLGVPGSYLVATEKSYIGNLVSLAGGTNIVPDAKVEFLASNTEYLQQSNPDIILRAAHGMPDEVIKMFDEEFKKNDIWKHFDAVKNGRVYDLPEELFGTTANLSAAEALKTLLPMLYPEEKGTVAS